jgi:hypothetical protein
MVPDVAGNTGEVRVGVMWFCEFVRNKKKDFGEGASLAMFFV